MGELVDQLQTPAANDSLTVRLVWSGPYADTATLPDAPGLYAVTGRVYGGMHLQLLYIGLAGSLRQRWSDVKHLAWLGSSVPCFGGGLYFAAASAELIDELESALIFVHQPNQNSSKLNSRPQGRRLIIHNVRDLPTGMLPVVDTAYPWFRYSGDSPMPVPTAGL